MRKILWSILTVLLIALVWYLFIKPSDYTIRFKANTFPGTINQALKLWDRSLDTVVGVTQQGNDIYHLKQKVQFGDSIHIYDWEFEAITDSTTEVGVDIRDENHSLSNKIRVPFSDTDFEKRSRKTVLDFIEKLNGHVNKFKVTIIGEEEIPTKFFAYIPLKLTQFQKAGGMMENLSYLTQVLTKNEVELAGPPMIQVTHWDMATDSLEYNFGQPVIRSEKLPMDTDIKYRRIFAKKALKAEYNGNYITSDRAWYALLDYAKAHNIEVEPKPVEIFYNNPNFGGNEMLWKAEIYMPIKENNE
ncbi:GyrI-like domain-containing protein [Flagellimonas onchidii]|uniref:GyrI-like domain-containing protein n=1 Tax=Flagellimonas onchidii TaxID=2562684 RepID=UPI0010A6A164|nr:GyrI-like domain-containing protein [Allomuricauda onchidii]